MDSYLATQFLAHLTEDEFVAKKELLKSMWEQFSSDYSLSDVDSWNVVVNDSVSIVEFDLSASIKDASGAVVKEYTQGMTATCFLTPNGWKIYNIVPTSVFEFNSVIDLLPDDSKGENVSDDKLPDFKAHKQPQRDVSCDEDGNCFKRAPSFRSSRISCSFDVDSFKDEKGYSLDDVSFAKTLIGNHKVIKLVIDDSYKFYYQLDDGFLKPVSAVDDVDYLITVDSCTLKRIAEGSDPQKEYDNGKIKISGQSFVSKVKSSIAKMIFEIYSWFLPKEPFELFIEAETGVLNNPGKYSFIGSSSRGPGELYLGTKDSFAEYDFKSDFEGDAYLSIRVNDDGLHKDYSRDALFTINGKKYPYHAKSMNTQKDGSSWAWVSLGKVHIVSGENKMVVSKPEQTSAAFIMDSFVISEKKIH